MGAPRTPLAAVRVREGWLAPASFHRRYTCSTDLLCINALVYFNKSQYALAPCINDILLCRVFYNTLYLEIVEYPEEGAHLLAAAVGSGAARLPQHAGVPGAEDHPHLYFLFTS